MNQSCSTQNGLEDAPNQSPDELAVLRTNLISLLEKSSELSKSNAARKTAKSTTTIHVAPVLFTSLRKCLQELNYKACAQIVKFLVESWQCNMDWVLQIITAILEKDPSQSSQLSSFLRKSSNLHNISRDEVRLIHLISQLNLGKHEEALNIASQVDGLQWSRYKRSTTAPEMSFHLLSSYKVLLQYLKSESSHGVSHPAAESFHALTEENCFVPLFAEAYTKLLLDANEPEKAEDFLYKFVEMESRDSGLLGPLQGLAIAKSHMPKNQSLIFDLLTKVVEKDASHPLVLELCWKYLRNSVPHEGNYESDSNLESEEEGDDFSTSKNLSKIENLSKCLKLVMNFLDTNMNSNEGWIILSENLRNMCLIGVKRCAAVLVNVWYRLDRRSWWLEQYFSIPSDINSTPVNLLINKAVSCFILEDESHPFVDYVLKSPNSSQLKSLIGQLSKPKKKLDEMVHPIFVCCTRPANELITNRPATEDEVEIRKLFLEFLESEVQTDEKAEGFNSLLSQRPVQIADSIEIKKYDANFFWDLPVYQRFKERLTKRKINKARPERSMSKKKSAKRIIRTYTSPENQLSDVNGADDTSSTDTSPPNSCIQHDDSVFIKPSARPESSFMPPSSFPCPTPDLLFPVTQVPKESIGIEERYQFFMRDSSPSSASGSSSKHLNSTSMDYSITRSLKKEIRSIASSPCKPRASCSMSLISPSVSNYQCTSSPDIFQFPPESQATDQEESLDTHNRKQVFGKIRPQDCSTNEKKKRKTKLKKPSVEGNLTKICFQLLDSISQDHQSASSVREDRGQSSEAFQKKNPSSSLQKTKISPQHKSKMKKRKNSREDIIDELLMMTNQSIQKHINSPAESSVKKKKFTGPTDEREEIIAELIEINRKALADASSNEKPTKDLCTENDLLTSARVPKCESSATNYNHDNGSNHQSGRGNDHTENLSLQDIERRNLDLVDQLINQSNSIKQRVEQWLDHVLVENAAGASRANQVSKKSRKTGPLSDRHLIQGEKRKRASKLGKGTNTQGTQKNPHSSSQVLFKTVNGPASSSQVSKSHRPQAKRKRLFPKTGNFLEAPYLSGGSFCE